MDHRQSAALQKQQLIEKVVSVQEGVWNGTIRLHATTNDAVSPSQRQEQQLGKLIKSLYEASLTSCFMEPRTASRGMKERSQNEEFILRFLPDCFSNNGVPNIPRQAIDER